MLFWKVIIMSKTPQSKKNKECNRPDWEKIRKEDFSLSCEYIYMNNSSFGATLNCVRKSMEDVNQMFAEGFYLERIFNVIQVLWVKYANVYRGL